MCRQWLSWSQLITHWEMCQSAVLLSDNLWSAYCVHRPASSWRCSLGSPAMPRLWTTGCKVTKEQYAPDLPLTPFGLLSFHSRLVQNPVGWGIVLEKRDLSSAMCTFPFSSSTFPCAAQRVAFNLWWTWVRQNPLEWSVCGQHSAAFLLTNSVKTFFFKLQTLAHTHCHHCSEDHCFSASFRMLHSLRFF